MGKHDPYSNSKNCTELVTAAYRRSFFEHHGVAVASARAGNVIGGGDWAVDRIIPDFFRASALGTELMVRSPDATRPWQHVLEPLSGYLTLAERLFTGGQSFAQSWNFGPGDEDAKPVRWLLSELVGLMPGSAWQKTSEPSVHEANYLKLDSSLARSRLGWKPQWDIRRALEKTVEWQLQWTRKQDMKQASLKQISEYHAASEE
jgi:CDP-glucose 4,6-dehydratase